VIGSAGQPAEQPDPKKPTDSARSSWGLEPRKCRWMPGDGWRGVAGVRSESADSQKRLRRISLSPSSRCPVHPGGTASVGSVFGRQGGKVFLGRAGAGVRPCIRCRPLCRPSPAGPRKRQTHASSRGGRGRAFRWPGGFFGRGPGTRRPLAHGHLERLSTLVQVRDAGMAVPSGPSCNTDQGV